MYWNKPRLLNVTGKAGFPHDKNKTGFDTIISLKFTKDLSVKPEALKLPEKPIFQDTVIGKDFPLRTAAPRNESQELTTGRDRVKLTGFRHSKGNARQSTGCKEIFKSLSAPQQAGD